MTEDLYTLLRKRQDELRGRPLDWRDTMQEWGRWLRYVHWSDVIVVGCMILIVSDLTAITIVLAVVMISR